MSRKDLLQYGEVKELDEDGTAMTATVLVPRKVAAKTAAKILEKLPVQDVNIEEPPIEAIIREVFQTKNE